MTTLSSNRKLTSKLFFKLLPYQVLLLLITASTGIVDSIFASNAIGEAAMGAIGFYSPLNHFLYAVSIMLVSGSQLLVGEAMGKNDTKKVHGFFTTDLILALVISLLSSLLLIVGALTDVSRVLVAGQAEREAINMYFIGQACGIPALVLGQQFFAFLSLENQTKRTMVASVTCFAANAFMDAAFILVFHMGTLGLGLATAISNWIFMGVMAVYYIAGKSEFKFSLKKFSLRSSKAILRKGYSGAISRFVEMFRNIFVNVIILKVVGSIGLSAFAAVDSVMALFWPLVFGMIAVSRMMMSISLGEEDRQTLADINRAIMSKGLLVVTVVSRTITALCLPLTHLFYSTSSGPIFGMTVMGFILMPFCMPPSVISLQYASYGQATEKKFFSVVLPILDGAVFVVGFALILIPTLGMNGLYLANILNGLCCCLVIFIYLLIRLKHRPRSMEEALLIPDDFGAPEDARLDLSLDQLEAVTQVSIEVVEFCRRRGVDERRAFFSGLAMEEMVRNIVEFGFTSDHKKHSVDIRVIHVDDDVILRLRDNCIRFNPLDRTAILDVEDRIRNVGIRLMNGIVKDVQYKNLLGINVLTMKL